ncbi:tRNA (adenosine(37)-N6)-threonylcarbamoyltransferase complex dimerization subunit type 1 TsaB [Flavobacterium sp.]|jgi:tRNA threonylcarbamoyladenosine biosynthesis protein TsaB|uniref:tRNA (adenosine(37)-N6)-threonylcarbamoyltransferase complex dimerization subunit type 1 TsaB n=1 Tax=Flavobacterium sp. TaxID=239 RepID=UPI002A80CE22|nr:tRNA (adenosine(37)-N6)-threonylcarbamoyltransferase complex dimerization subunit type 1 TsaB [Flavobacterium sp.]
MSFILSIETATKNCSIALSENGKTVALKEIASHNFSHAEKLHVFIEEILIENNITFKDLSAIAVSKGPGSYTGLRIGVSSAKGLCYALNIPLISVDTLTALAKQLTIEDGIIISMIDARRMEVYAAFFNPQFEMIKNVEALIIDEKSFSEIESTIHLIGDGALKFKETLTDDKFKFHNDIIYPSANEMSSFAFEKYKISDFENVAYFEPYYLKDFVLNR